MYRLPLPCSKGFLKHLFFIFNLINQTIYTNKPVCSMCITLNADAAWRTTLVEHRFYSFSESALFISKVDVLSNCLMFCSVIYSIAA